jgi:hypothetical protein
MSQCWRRIVVDGTIAERQANDGPFPLEFCRGYGGKLSPRKQVTQSDAGDERWRKHITSSESEPSSTSEAEDYIQETLSSNESAVPSSACGDCNNVKTSLEKQSQTIRSAISGFHRVMEHGATLENRVASSIAQSNKRLRLLTSPSPSPSPQSCCHQPASSLDPFSFAFDERSVSYLCENSFSHTSFSNRSWPYSVSVERRDGRCHVLIEGYGTSPRSPVSGCQSIPIQPVVS